MDGRRLRTISDQLAPVRISPAHVTQFVDEQVSRLEGDARQRQTAFYTGLEYPETFPAYAGLLVDSEDNVWVKEYALPGATREVWRVYSSDGARLSIIPMPPRFRVLEVAGGTVLGVWKDEFDVEYVRVYTLRK